MKYLDGQAGSDLECRTNGHTGKHSKIKPLELYLTFSAFGSIAVAGVVFMFGGAAGQSIENIALNVALGGLALGAFYYSVEHFSRNLR